MGVVHVYQSQHWHTVTIIIQIPQQNNMICIFQSQRKKKMPSFKTALIESNYIARKYCEEHMELCLSTTSDETVFDTESSSEVVEEPST